MTDEAWQQFEAILRNILDLRTSGASDEVIDAAVEAAWDEWDHVPHPPAGTQVVWSPDVADIASELGFAAAAAPVLQDSTAEAARLQQLAAQIDEAIMHAGGVGDVRVACSTVGVTITGVAADEESRDQALIIAAQLAPGMQLHDGIRVA